MTDTKRPGPAATRLSKEQQARYATQGIGNSAGMTRDLRRYQQLLDRGRLQLRLYDFDPERLLIAAQGTANTVDTVATLYPHLHDAVSFALADDLDTARGMIAAGCTPEDALATLGLLTDATHPQRRIVRDPA